jgi:pimeloyl-ACP methyl ester carboxylesterase
MPAPAAPRRRATVPKPGAIATARGAVRLAVEGVQGVTNIAEGLHGQIVRAAPPLGRAAERPLGGISGFVYRGIRAGSGWVGSGLDALLATVQALQPPTEGEAPDAPVPLALRSALNGVMGDHLARTGNPLAIPMSLQVRGPATPRMLLLIHGLCMNEQQWQRQGHDHGIALADALGCTPVYLRYNSGRHVNENGAELAALLEETAAGWPVPLREIAIVGHSMGGLVARSALRQADDAGMTWPRLLRQMVFLGTPHHGAALERGGNWLHTVLGVSPYLAPFTRLARLRSDGITDLRHGNLLASDWQAGPYLQRDTRTVVALPHGVACYAIAGALASPGAAKALGDGLVSVDSALGRHERPTHDLRIPPRHTWVAQGVHHLDLLSDARVYRKLRAWLR